MNNVSIFIKLAYIILNKCIPFLYNFLVIGSYNFSTLWNNFLKSNYYYIRILWPLEIKYVAIHIKLFWGFKSIQIPVYYINAHILKISILFPLLLEFLFVKVDEVVLKFSLLSQEYINYLMFLLIRKVLINKSF